MLVHADGRVPAGEIGHPRVALRRPHVVRALHVHPVRGRLVHDRVPRRRHHHQRGRRQGRDGRQVRGLQALHDRLPVRDDVLRHVHAQSVQVQPLRRRSGVRGRVPDRRDHVRGDRDVRLAGGLRERARVAEHVPWRKERADAGPSPDHRRRHRGHQRDPHHPRGRGREVADHAGERGAAVLAHGAAVLPRPLDRRVPRLHRHRVRPRRLGGGDAPRPARGEPRRRSRTSARSTTGRRSSTTTA